MLKPKKKHNWMAGFILPKKLDDAELVRAETSRRLCDDQNKLIQNRGLR